MRGGGRVLPFLLILAALVGLLLGCAGPTVVGRTGEGFPVVRVTLRLSNVYVIDAKRPILIDSGTVGDLHDLEQALKDQGVWPSQVALVVLTHGHADHAGLAADIRDESGAAIWMGAGDLPLARAGENDVLSPTSVVAASVKPFITSVYRDFEPDVAVTSPMSLAPYGIDGEVVPMPGHTKGSLVVILGNHTAFVGDMMMGGLGGLLFPTSPREHLYQADREANRRNLESLVKRGIVTFYLGHGGPVSREDVMKAFGIAER
jgi:hydroxyacylglutathione hydrolase